MVGVSPARASEFDTYNEHPGSLISVAEGTVNADTLWLCTSNDGGTLDTTAIAFSKMIIAGELLAQNNLSDLQDANAARTALGLAIGSNVQAFDSDLSAVAGLSTTGLVARTGAGTAATRAITGTANQITVANGDGVSGNPTLSLPADVVIPTIVTAPNTGLHVLDTDASHDLILKPGSNLTADRTLTLTTGDADATLDVANVRTASITFIIDDGGSVIATGIKGDLEIPFGCTIQAVTLLADQTGSIVIDIWKDSYAAYPPTVADTITASAKPTLSSAAEVARYQLDRLDHEHQCRADPALQRLQCFGRHAGNLVTQSAQDLRAPEMSFPSFVSATFKTHPSSASHSVDLPSVSAGDLLIVLYNSDSNGNPTDPSGWNVLKAGGSRQAAWSRICDGTEGSTLTLTISPSRAGKTAVIKITGAHASQEPEAANQGTSHDPPNLAPSWGSREVMWIAVDLYLNGSVTAYPTSYADNQNDYAGT